MDEDSIIKLKKFIEILKLNMTENNIKVTVLLS